MKSIALLTKGRTFWIRTWICSRCHSCRTRSWCPRCPAGWPKNQASRSTPALSLTRGSSPCPCNRTSWMLHRPPGPYPCPFPSCPSGSLLQIASNQNRNSRGSCSVGQTFKFHLLAPFLSVFGTQSWPGWLWSLPGWSNPCSRHRTCQTRRGGPTSCHLAECQPGVLYQR